MIYILMKYGAQLEFCDINCCKFKKMGWKECPPCVSQQGPICWVQIHLEPVY